MLKISEIVRYIEAKEGFKLTKLQIDILKHIVKGDTIYTSRGCGRSFLYNGYADYLKNVVGKSVDFSIDPLDFDKVYTYEDINLSDDNVKLINERLVENMKSKSKDFFDREFACEYIVK